jgi:uncharacterized protein (DUF302 family)
MSPSELPGGDHGIVTIKSPHPFSDTVERLETALRAKGIKIFAGIDQQAEAAAVGLRMPPTVLLIFGNPKGGTPLMVARPLSGLDLPLKALISEAQPGEVLVSLNSAEYLIQRHALPAEFLSNIAPIEQLIRKTLNGDRALQ